MTGSKLLLHSFFSDDGGNHPATSYVERLMGVFREKHVLNSLYLPNIGRKRVKTFPRD